MNINKIRKELETDYWNKSFPNIYYITETHSSRILRSKITNTIYDYVSNIKSLLESEIWIYY